MTQQARTSIAEAIIIALKDKHLFVRKTAAETLGQMGDTRAIEPLITLLGEKKWSLRKTSAEALVKIYRSGLLDEAHKRLILSQRGRISSVHSDQGGCNKPW